MTRKDKTDPLQRRLKMLEMIPHAPRKIDTATLRGRLEVAGYPIDLRSVQRDLVALSHAWPLVADDGNPRGWSWQADAAMLSLPTLDPQAALTFKLVEDYLRPLLPASTLACLEPWFRTATGILEANANGLAHWRDKVRAMPSGQPLATPEIDAEVQGALYQALLEERRAAIAYQPRATAESREYVVNPLALVVRDRVIYLVCTMWDYEDIRHLVLHRVRAARMLDEPARRPAGFDLDEHIRKGEFGFPLEESSIVLEADFTQHAAAHLYESPLSEDQTLTALDDDTVRLRATVHDTWELRWWLQGFGDHVVVQVPAELREYFGEVAANLASCYADEDAAEEPSA